MTTATKTTIAERIAAKEAELAQAKAALLAAAEYRSGVRSRTKTHVVRMDGAIRRAGQAAATIRRLEAEIAALHRKTAESVLPPLDLSRLPFAFAVRTKWGWFKVLKVNRKTVKVEMPPGWDDLIRIDRIVEIYEKETPA